MLQRKQPHVDAGAEAIAASIASIVTTTTNITKLEEELNKAEEELNKAEAERNKWSAKVEDPSYDDRAFAQTRETHYQERVNNIQNTLINARNALMEEKKLLNAKEAHHQELLLVAQKSEPILPHPPPHQRGTHNHEESWFEFRTRRRLASKPIQDVIKSVLGAHIQWPLASDVMLHALKLPVDSVHAVKAINAGLVAAPNFPALPNFLLSCLGDSSLAKGMHLKDFPAVKYSDMCAVLLASSGSGKTRKIYELLCDELHWIQTCE